MQGCGWLLPIRRRWAASEINSRFVSHFLNDPATDYSSLNVAAVFDDLLTRRSGISASGAVPDTAPGSPAKQAGDAQVHS